MTEVRLQPVCHQHGCTPRTNGRHLWVDHGSGCPHYKGVPPLALTAAERGRMGGLVGGRPRRGKHPQRMPWWEQALRDGNESGRAWDLEAAITCLREARLARSRRIG